MCALSSSSRTVFHLHHNAVKTKIITPKANPKQSKSKEDCKEVCESSCPHCCPIAPTGSRPIAMLILRVVLLSVAIGVGSHASHFGVPLIQFFLHLQRRPNHTHASKPEVFIGIGFWCLCQHNSTPLGSVSEEQSHHWPSPGSKVFCQTHAWPGRILVSMLAVLQS